MKILSVPSRFEIQADAIAYIAACERSFSDRVVSIADDLSRVEGLRLIGLSGPTCAGKTTTADLLVRHLEELGKRVHMISVDDFFREQPNARQTAKEAGSIDFDSIEALDFKLFAECLERLMTTGRALLPKFNLSAGMRTGFRDLIAPNANDVFLVEGIQVVYPEISALLYQYPYRSVFSNVGMALSVDGVTYTPEQIRFMRRTVRDYYFRSSDAAFTYFLWDSVRANELKNILPNAEACDVQLESLMGYEIGMLRPHLEIILHQLPLSNVHRRKADDILDHISHVQPLHPSWLPSNALYREFVPVS